MTIRKRATTSRRWDLAVACFHLSVPHGYSYDERECSFSSTVSDADSSAIHHPHAVATLKRGIESVEIGSACLEMLRGISSVSPDDYNRVRNEEIFREAAWTDQKHRSYLNLMEAEFVRSLYHQNYRAPCCADSVDEDCVESHITINSKTSCESEEIHVVKSRQALRPITELGGLTCLSPSTSNLSNISGSELETDSSRSSWSVCVDAGFQTNKTKKRTLEIGHELCIDLELRLSDLTTRLFKQRDANFMSDKIFQEKIEHKT